MGRPKSGINKEKITAYIDKDLLEKFRDAAYQKTKSFKGISKCMEEAMKEWLKKGK